MGRRKRTHTRQPSIIRSSVDRQFSPSKQTDDIQIDMGRDIDMGNMDDIDMESSDTDESQAGLPSPWFCGAFKLIQLCSTECGKEKITKAAFLKFY